MTLSQLDCEIESLLLSTKNLLLIFVQMNKSAAFGTVDLIDLMIYIMENF